MKQNEIDNVNKLKPQNYENIFNVYENTDGMYYYNLLTTINFPTDLDPNTYTFYTVKTKDTWTKIAWDFYEDVKLWWVVCAANNVINPLEPLETGKQIKILTPITVRGVLNTINSST